jgi:DNA modification methylase
MKPYYQHAGITIYHGDCREILPGMLEPDLLLADPPYGAGISVDSDIMEEAKAERAKLLEENALLRRSLEMLTKQLDEKDAEMTDLRFTIIRHNSPA